MGAKKSTTWLRIIRTIKSSEIGLSPIETAEKSGLTLYNVDLELKYLVEAGFLKAHESRYQINPQHDEIVEFMLRNVTIDDLRDRIDEMPKEILKRIRRGQIFGFVVGWIFGVVTDIVLRLLV